MSIEPAIAKTVRQGNDLGRRRVWSYGGLAAASPAMINSKSQRSVRLGLWGSRIRLGPTF
jgi:hypothetical protein